MLKVVLINLLAISAFCQITQGSLLNDSNMHVSDEQDKEAGNVIRRLLGFIILNNHCFSQNQLNSDLENIIGEDLSELTDDLQKNHNRGIGKVHFKSMVDTIKNRALSKLKRSQNIKYEKKGYSKNLDDDGTILYIGKRNNF